MTSWAASEADCQHLANRDPGDGAVLGTWNCILYRPEISALLQVTLCIMYNVDGFSMEYKIWNV